VPRHPSLLRLRILLLIALAWLPAIAQAITSAAFYYGAEPPWDELAAFDLAVVEPDHAKTPPALARTKVLAYLGVGEVNASRKYLADIPEGWRRGFNPNWGAALIDQAEAAWPRFVVERIVAPLWAQGYRGFFLDTLDSYLLYAKTPEERAAQVAGMVRVIEAIKAAYPAAELVLNRGFELLPAVSRHVIAVAAESIYAGWDAAAQQYREVPAQWRDDLLPHLREVQERYRLPVIAIDYAPPGDRAGARATADRLRALGFIPWVANGALDALGIGAVEVMPRKVLMLYASGRGQYGLVLEYVARYASMPLNWLGYVPEFRDVQAEPLPAHTLAGRYAGIVTWFYGDLGQHDRPVRDLLARAQREGVKIAMLGHPGFSPGDALNAVLPLQSRAYPAFTGAVHYERKEGLGHEFMPVPDRRMFFPLRSPDSDVTVRITTDRGEVMDAVAYTPWGGYALEPYTVIVLPNERGARWAIDPFQFFRRALALPAMPVPDVTTANGRRMLLAHIDGDGFANRAEFRPAWARPPRPVAPGAKPAATANDGVFAAEVLLRDVLAKYRIPTTMSVIQAEVGPNGLYPQLSPVLEGIAREMFALPHVDIASHSFSHPFQWGAASAAAQAKVADTATPADYALPVPGYRFDLATEVQGSIRYIEDRLAPAGKRVRLFLWTGDCNPGLDALAQVAGAGIGNMNGGDTWITRAEPTVTQVSPIGLAKGGYFQVYAPNQNENVYTNGFRGPFYGFQRVIETFELTDAPRRLKPMNIYFHTYSAAKRASLTAVQKVFEHAIAQRPHPVHAAEYVAIAQDFNRTVVARTPGGFLVRNAGALRTLRVPVAAGYPVLAPGNGVVGFNDHQDERYIHTAGDEALVALRPDSPRGAWLVSANARVTAFERTAGATGSARTDGSAAAPATTTLRLQGHVPLAFELSAGARCEVRAGGTTIPPAGAPNGVPTYDLERNGATDATIVCSD